MMRTWPGDCGGAVPPWTTLICCPARVIVAERAFGPVFFVSEYVAEPDPEPDPVTLTHESDALDVHPQPAVDVTVNVPLAADAPVETDVGDTV